MHHLSWLSADKDNKHEKIHFYMAKCDENMSNSYRASFLIFWFYYVTNPISFFGIQMVEFHIFMSYTNARTWVKFNGLMDVNYPEGEEENDYTFLGSWSTFFVFLRIYSNLSTF